MDVKIQWIDKTRLDSAENTIRNIRRNYPECSKKDKDGVTMQEVKRCGRMIRDPCG